MPLSCEAIQNIPAPRIGDFDSMSNTSIQQSAASGCQTSLVMANINDHVQAGQSYAATIDEIPDPLQTGGNKKRQTKKRQTKKRQNKKKRKSIKKKNKMHKTRRNKNKRVKNKSKSKKNKQKRYKK
tara:strand:+ start:460 stop:837 length:378 start_codon:yes stop_codon:yes gene_type:complete